MIEIGGKAIGRSQRPFVIAEMSGNHNQSLDKALEIVRAAAHAGAQALKIQTYTAETMTLDIKENEFRISNPQSLWQGRTLFDLYKEAYTPWDWHKPIFNLCKELGLIGFSTPFDSTAVEFLEKLDVPCYKIASFENTDLPLIRMVASKGKPVIISTGMASLSELDDAVKTAREAGCKDLILLKCTSTYPASPENSNVLTIPHMREMFQCEVGLSDHTGGIGAAVAAVAHGASVIEKHFTISRAEGGVDSAFSLEPDELKDLVVETDRAWLSLGSVKYGANAAEKESMIFRRSIYVTENLKRGEKLNPENIRCVRPGLGLPPKYFDLLIGRSVKQDTPKGTPVTWDLLI